MIHLHAVVESYPPGMRAGSEMAAHTLFAYLADHGWKVTVHITRHPDQAYLMDGVWVTTQMEEPDADLVYTHLWEAWPKAQQAARAADAPILYWIHANSPKPPPADILLANTTYLADRWGAELVLHPPVQMSDYRVEAPGSRVTRIGLAENKGGRVFWDLARSMPHVEFLGVVGAWGRQIVETPPPNTMVWGTTTDMRRVYQETRVLIMPSDSHETYGRVAVEAVASGIPVIAHPWQGIYEALGDAGIYADRADLACYRSLIECLQDPDEYAYHSKLCRSRAGVLARRSGKELAALQSRLESILSPATAPSQGRTRVAAN